MRKVLIANRGEIAVRVARACRDAGVGSVAVYASSDIDAVHVKAADEAYSLDGDNAAETYLDIAKLVAIATRSGADAVHPGYGFLAENATFAQAVLDAGLVWIGPPPAAIEALGDKVRARHIAAAVGAPLTPGTPDPVAGVDDVIAFAHEHGLPIAIKAAFGGGGRGLKVARSISEIPALFDSAVREAVAAFGRGECFVERYLDRPRHVETQCLADTHGHVVVISTRDCSLQRRHQKLVEEAPAPFLTDDQMETLYADPHLSCLEKLYSLIDAYVVKLMSQPHFNKIWVREQVESQGVIADKIESVRQRNFNTITRIVKDGQDNGEFKHEVDAFLIMAMLVGTTNQVLTTATWRKAQLFVDNKVLRNRFKSRAGRRRRQCIRKRGITTH